MDDRAFRTPGAVEEATSDEERWEFPCDNCGAKLTWDPGADALSCEYCGTVREVLREDRTIVERALEDAGSAARGLGVEVRVSSCRNCGAKISFETTSTAECCPYCGSASVLAQEANRNALRPESLVPLDVGREEVQADFRRWIKGLWFRPNTLKKTERFEAVGIYVPFWTFDCRVHSDWSAQAGHYYHVTETYTTRVNGRRQTRTRRKRKIRWVPAWGSRDDAFDDLLIHASRSLSARVLGRLGGFDTDALVPYEPEYLAGWRAEEYQVDLEEGWKLGRAEVEATQRSRCASDVPGDTHRNLHVQNQITDVRWKHVLLPIWSLQYAFRGKTYTVLINGQSGRIAGEAPFSWWKIAGLVLAIGLVVLIALLVVVAN